MIRLRRAWFQLHKWIGLILAILIIPLSLSGSALVWRGWLDAQVNPHRYPVVSSPLATPGTYAEAANSLLKPGDRIVSMAFPDKAGSVQVTITKAPLGDSRPQRAWIWLDPTSAEPLDRANMNEGVVRVLHTLHGNLMYPGVGRKVVGWIGVAMFISSLTGIWLWWPLKGSVTRGLRWNRRPDFNSNLHHLGGFWIAIPLAIMSGTGAWISFPGAFSVLSGSPVGHVGPGSQGQPLTLPRQSVDQAATSAQKLVSGRLTNVAWPTDKSPEWTVKVTANGKASEIKVRDLDATATLAPERPQTVARTMERIHDGSDMPLWWQIVMFISGILPAILAVTGILMWLRMRRRRERHRRGAAAMAESEALES